MTAAAATEVPRIETARLVLRGHRAADFPACAALWADPDVTRFISTAPASEEEAWARFLRYAGHWAMVGFGYWAVEEKASGRYVANVGFAHHRRAIVPPLEAPEVGWVLATDAAGRGYATEAVAATLGWADANLAAAETVCIVRPDNLRSLRVAEKSGFVRRGSARYGGRETTVWARPRGA